ncbi:hypothetical protein Btru_062412 [Bulinus truncatus]|nr:hypothetical protein Btru_062412 [Bulinus truncatus]
MQREYDEDRGGSFTTCPNIDIKNMDSTLYQLSMNLPPEHKMIQIPVRSFREMFPNEPVTSDALGTQQIALLKRGRQNCVFKRQKLVLNGEKGKVLDTQVIDQIDGREIRSKLMDETELEIYRDTDTDNDAAKKKVIGHKKNRAGGMINHPHKITETFGIKLTEYKN